MKLDTNSPNPGAWLTITQDTPIQPLGLPAAAFSEGSTGLPKGLSYLHTKDFLGPVYRVFFPELVTQRAGASLPDTMMLNFSHRKSDLLVQKSGITIREGEGIALISSAETAVGVAVVGTSGWGVFDVYCTIDIEPATSPFLTFTGLKNPTEIRIYEAGTQTLLAGQENITSGSYSWNYDPDLASSVDVAVLSLGYLNFRLLGLSLTSAGATVPIQQQVDRQYINP
jgi:hypothetical protein